MLLGLLATLIHACGGEWRVVRDGVGDAVGLCATSNADLGALPTSGTLEAFGASAIALQVHCAPDVRAAAVAATTRRERTRTLLDAALLDDGVEVDALDECNVYERLLQPLLRVGGVRAFAATTTLVVSRALLAFVERAPLRRALVRALFADVVAIDDVASMRRVGVIALRGAGTANERRGNDDDDNNNNNNDDVNVGDDAKRVTEFVRALLGNEWRRNARNASSSSSAVAAMAHVVATASSYAGLRRGSGGKNLLSPICGEDACAAWRVAHIDRLARNSAADTAAVSIEVVMMSDGRQRRWAERTEALNRELALSAGWRFTAYNDSLDESRATAWSKVVALQRHVARALARHDRRPHFILWLDADSFIERDGAARIRALAQLALDAGRDAVLPADPPVWQCENLCTGIMLWRASVWTRDFLALWWADATTRFGGTFMQSFSWEQRILNAIWHDVAERFYVVPYCVLNAPCATPPQSGAAVVHCMGADQHTRLTRVALAEDDRRAHGVASLQFAARQQQQQQQLPSAQRMAALTTTTRRGIVAIGTRVDSDALRGPTSMRVRVVDRQTPLDDALSSLLAARVVVAHDGDAPLIAALVDAMQSVDKRQVVRSDINLTLVERRESVVLAASCRDVVARARARGIVYQRLTTSVDWTALAAIDGE